MNLSRDSALLAFICHSSTRFSSSSNLACHQGLRDSLLGDAHHLIMPMQEHERLHKATDHSSRRRCSIKNSIVASENGVMALHLPRGLSSPALLLDIGQNRARLSWSMVFVGRQQQRLPATRLITFETRCSDISQPCCRR